MLIEITVVRILERSVREISKILRVTKPRSAQSCLCAAAWIGSRAAYSYPNHLSIGQTPLQKLKNLAHHTFLWKRQQAISFRLRDGHSQNQRHIVSIRERDIDFVVEHRRLRKLHRATFIVLLFRVTSACSTFSSDTAIGSIT